VPVFSNFGEHPGALQPGKTVLHCGGMVRCRTQDKRSGTA